MLGKASNEAVGDRKAVKAVKIVYQLGYNLPYHLLDVVKETTLRNAEPC